LEDDRVGARNYSDLLAWQKAMERVVEVYKATKAFPKEEICGLTAQLRRAVVSIPSNIAEGQGRRADRQFQNFLSIAHGSVRETETQILIAERLGYLDAPKRQDLLTIAAETGRLITGLANSLDQL
jgi:four helix bundle protein